MFYLSAVALTTMCTGLVYGYSSSCQTPGGKSGECIAISKCKPLMTLLDKSNKTDQDLTLLVKSHCGTVLGESKVCCPNQLQSEPVNGGSASCNTPDGKTGKCISVYMCRHIANMLRPPVSEKNMAFVKKSRCSGPAKYNVCCGRPPEEGCPANMTAFPPEPSSKCCGDTAGSNNKIIGMGGIGTAIDQYPWAVIIEYAEGGQTVLYCGGVLISGKYVLTAAHCLTGFILQKATPRIVRLGEYDISNEGEDCVQAAGGGLDCTDGVTRIAIEKTIPHPNYDPEKSKRNDIGLIRLKNIAPLTDFIRPVCLPVKDLTRPENTPRNFSMYAVGWGATELNLLNNVKVQINLPFVSQEKCQAFYGGEKVALWKGQLCAGGNKGEDTCRGDSGGPLVYENQDRLFELIGIISFGSVPCGQNIPGVYTNVYEYLDWIKSVIVA